MRDRFSTNKLLHSARVNAVILNFWDRSVQPAWYLYQRKIPTMAVTRPQIPLSQDWDGGKLQLPCGVRHTGYRGIIWEVEPWSWPLTLSMCFSFFFFLWKWQVGRGPVPENKYAPYQKISLSLIQFRPLKDSYLIYWFTISQH